MLKNFFRLVAKQSSGFDLQVGFSKVDRTHKCSGLFDEQGLIGMLETSDSERVDQVLPFLGALADVFYGNENKAAVTKVCTMSFNFNISLKRILTQPCCVDKAVLRLAKMIHQFQDAENKLFGKYQAPGMRTQKWHKLDHIVLL